MDNIGVKESPRTCASGGLGCCHVGTGDATAVMAKDVTFGGVIKKGEAAKVATAWIIK